LPEAEQVVHRFAIGHRKAGVIVIADEVLAIKFFKKAMSSDLITFAFDVEFDVFEAEVGVILLEVRIAQMKGVLEHLVEILFRDFDESLGSPHLKMER
jgi:hypothetical protein